MRIQLSGHTNLDCKALHTALFVFYRIYRERGRVLIFSGALYLDNATLIAKPTNRGPVRACEELQEMPLFYSCKFVNNFPEPLDCLHRKDSHTGAKH